MVTVNKVLDTRYKFRSGEFAGLYKIVIRITIKGEFKDIDTGVRIDKKQWSKDRVIVKHHDSTMLNLHVNELWSKYNKIALECVRSGEYSFSEFTEEKRLSFTDYLRSKMDYYDRTGIKSRRNKLRAILVEFGEIGRPELTFKGMNTETIEKYHLHLVDKGLAKNTIHSKIRLLRQMFTKAQKEGVTSEKNLFEIFIVRPEKVPKLRLSFDEIKTMEQLILPPNEDHWRDFYLFSYYCKGMRFQNCLDVKNEHIRDGRIYFKKTSKSEKFISVIIHEKLQKIIKKYFNPDREYLWPKQHLASANVLCNKSLKRIGKLIGQPDLHIHSARHTFAFHLKTKGVNINAIKDSLGHSTTRQTENYLDELDDSSLDSMISVIY